MSRRSEGSRGRSSNQHWLDLERDRERETRMQRMRWGGMTYAEIGRLEHLSPARVGQILARLKREQENV